MVVGDDDLGFDVVRWVGDYCIVKPINVTNVAGQERCSRLERSARER